jgi:hypothetical protein
MAANLKCEGNSPRIVIRRALAARLVSPRGRRTDSRQQPDDWKRSSFLVHRDAVALAVWYRCPAPSIFNIHPGKFDIQDIGSENTKRRTTLASAHLTASATATPGSLRS